MENNYFQEYLRTYLYKISIPLVSRSLLTLRTKSRCLVVGPRLSQAFLLDFLCAPPTHRCRGCALDVTAYGILHVIGIRDMVSIDPLLTVVIVEGGASLNFVV